MALKQPGMTRRIWLGAKRERLMHRAIDELRLANEHELMRDALDEFLYGRGYRDEVAELRQEQQRRRKEARRA